eukprot:12935200-Prorocentrum_lima.AAC.1
MKLARNPRTRSSSCECMAGVFSLMTSAGNNSLTFAKLHSRLRHTVVRAGCFRERLHAWNIPAKCRCMSPSFSP